ncbi:tRNA dihydrouridine synthase B [hydrothermal vent metagenome]|uniref:tRNA dihydrouridine synthase B n=1 Tax=hydrothermal vent metagenome TaxID=652676 RepID=A0A3B1E0J5_9ZZZZ
MNIDFSKKIISLAPLAGYTDLPFRSIVKRFGVDFTVSEMISSNALVYKSKRTLKMTQKGKNENAYFVQIAGNDIDMIKRSVEILNKLDDVIGIDLNCGCPSPKVSGHGSGSSLLKDTIKLSSMIEAIKKNSNKKYTTAKVRIGFDKKIPIEIAKACQDGGADFITVHGRTKVGGYKAPVDYDAIKDMKQSISIPLIANGDIKDYKKAQEVLEYTKADGVTIGRGAIGNPWIFYELKNKGFKPSLEIKREIILEHLSLMYDFYGDRGIILFRKHLHSYSKGIQNSSIFRQAVNIAETKNKLEELINSHFVN